VSSGQISVILVWLVVLRPTFFILLFGFLLGFGSRYLDTIAAFALSPHDDGALYNFEHNMLNLPIDCKSMRMNVGYWNASRFMALLLPQHLSDSHDLQRTDEFDMACGNLLKLILEKAGLSRSTTRPLRLILDLGCGDSSLSNHP
jgi:hypothetical protein